MSKKNNRTCIVCGKQYRYCSHGCGADLDKPVWMESFDSNNCRQICNLFTGNTIGKYISDEEAAIRLKKLDISKIESFDSKIKLWIEQLTAMVQDESAETQNENVEEIKEEEKEISSDDINEDEPVG